MSLRAGRHGVQWEITANLFVVVLAGLAVVAAVMGALAARSVETAALRELHLGARQLERTLSFGAPSLEDLSAVLRSTSSAALGGSWTVMDSRGRELGRTADFYLETPVLQTLANRARESGEVLQRSGLLLGDLVLALRIQTVRGERGTLVGMLPHDRLVARLQPMLYSGAWLLGIAAAIFVAFGAYLLRQRIVLPLARLSLATREISQGNLEVRTPESGSDELAELAHSFNRMADSLAREREALLSAHRSLAQGERLAAVGQLAAGMAHEVGNPTAAILSYVEVALRDPELSPRTRETIEHVRDEALRVRTLVRELLDLARSETFEPSPVDTGALLERVAQRLRTQPLLQNIELIVVGDDDLPPLRSDERRIEQILVNLIENAAHAVRGIPAPRIELSGERIAHPARPPRRHDDRASLPSEEALALAVTDNGAGIDPEDQPRLFDPFFTTKDPGQGTGLGLWNAQRLAGLLGGTLELESAAGRTCFSLILPAADTEGGHVSAPGSDH